MVMCCGEDVCRVSASVEVDGPGGLGVGRDSLKRGKMKYKILVLV